MNLTDVFKTNDDKTVMVYEKNLTFVFGNICTHTMSTV